MTTEPGSTGRQEGAHGVGEIYLPVLVLGVLGLAFGLFALFAPVVIGPRRYNRAKLDAYECGIDPTPQPIGGGRFPIRYYLTAMLFIVFDIELAFLYPIAVTLRDDGVLGLVVLLVFVFTVVEALTYIWKKGALEWR